jgi:hypothetical protein
MRPKNGQLIAVVAAVAVAAVTIGGALAYRQGPRSGLNAEAAPLSGSPSPSTPSTTTATPTPVPTPTPKPTPSTTPSRPSVTPSTKPTQSGPVKSTISLKRLMQGRAPQATYLSGRTVRGGAGNDVKVPGTNSIGDVARLNQSVLAVVRSPNGTGSEMLTIDELGKVIRRTPDITGIVTTEDGQAAAYIATRTSSTSSALPGATVYAEERSVEKVTVPDAWDAVLLGYVNGKVYFRADPKDAASTWSLYQWIPGESKVTAIKTVPQPTALSSDGTIAASLTNLTDYHSCTNVVAVATGKRLWRTCDYQVVGFTRDSSVAIGAPFYRDGYSDGVTAALDAATGTLLHEWTGSFIGAVAEDDQHLLIRADYGEDDPSSIIRCATTTGACELATPLVKGDLRLGS